MPKHKLIAPLRIGYYTAKRTGITKYFTLNLNQYRNALYHLLNDSKIAFKEYMQEQIKQLPEIKDTALYSVTYTVFAGSNRLFDVSNICCIVDKYFMDALVEEGKIPDDNYKIVPKVIYSFGAIDKDNPRVEIEIDY